MKRTADENDNITSRPAAKVSSLGSMDPIDIFEMAMNKSCMIDLQGLSAIRRTCKAGNLLYSEDGVTMRDYRLVLACPYILVRSPTHNGLCTAGFAARHRGEGTRAFGGYHDWARWTIAEQEATNQEFDLWLDHFLTFAEHVNGLPLDMTKDIIIRMIVAFIVVEPTMARFKPVEFSPLIRMRKLEAKARAEGKTDEEVKSIFDDYLNAIEAAETDPVLLKYAKLSNWLHSWQSIVAEDEELCMKFWDELWMSLHCMYTTAYAYECKVRNPHTDIGWVLFQPNFFDHLVYDTYENMDPFMNPLDNRLEDFVPTFVRIMLTVEEIVPHVLVAFPELIHETLSNPQLFIPEALPKTPNHMLANGLFMRSIAMKVMDGCKIWERVPKPRMHFGLETGVIHGIYREEMLEYFTRMYPQHAEKLRTFQLTFSDPSLTRYVVETEALTELQIQLLNTITMSILCEHYTPRLLNHIVEVYIRNIIDLDLPRSHIHRGILLMN